MRIKNLLLDNAYLIAISLTVFIVYLSLDSFTQVYVPVNNLDKIFHGIAYFTVTISWLFAIKKSHSSFKVKVIIAFFVFCFGIIIEVLQSSLTTYRFAEFNDIIANSFGILIATVLFNRLLQFYKMI